MALLEEAIIFATHAHSGQFRKGTNTPISLVRIKNLSQSEGQVNNSSVK